MVAGLLTELEEVNNKTRQQKQAGRIIKYLSKSDAAVTIPEISKHVKISIPTTTKLINELISKNWMLEKGKRETDNGRKPTLYSINKEKFYAVGVEILLKRIQVKVMRINSTEVHEVKDNAFVLENTKQCLSQVIEFIRSAINHSKIATDQIMGVGIGITGRVNSQTGESFNYFNFSDLSLKQHVEDALGLPVFIDNDTRVLGLAEQVAGKAKKAGNALVVNMSRGLGISVIINKKVVPGGMGFAGEFGHMQLGKSERLCLCGKKGCLGTEVSGYALEEDLKEALNNGEASIYFNKADGRQYRYDDMLEAALKGDSLSIRLIQEQGDKLGEALGNILNLLNPELIVIGGKIARVNELFVDSVKAGMKKTALINSLKFCKVEVSNLGSEAGPKGAASMVWKKYEMI